MFPKRSYFLVWALTLICLTSMERLASAQLQNSQDEGLYPSSIVGQRAEKFMRAFNSGDEKDLERYLEEHMSPDTLESQPLDRLVEAFAAIHQQVGELDVAAVQATSEYEVVIKAESSRASAWLDIVFSVESEEPHHQVKLALTPGRAPDAIVYDNWKDLKELVSQLRESTGTPSMAIAIVKNGNIAQSEVSGVRSLETAQQAEISDAFHIGSVGKSMTALLVGRLIEEGKLKWQTTVGEVFADVEMNEVYRSVSILQLMNHQGGLPAFVDDQEFDLESFVDDELSPTEQRMKFAKEALSREPQGQAGEETIYSNAGYVLLGAIAEKTMNRSFEVLMAEYVFTPLELETAGFGWPAKNDNDHAPTGHLVVDGKTRAQKKGEINVGHFLVPAGDMHVSIQDLAKYAIFHLDGLSEKEGLVDSAVINRLHQPPVDQNYACGWVISKSPDGTPMHFHNGSLGTFYSAVFLYPQHEAAIVVATNLGSGVEPEVLKAVEAIFQKVISSKDSD